MSKTQRYDNARDQLLELRDKHQIAKRRHAKTRQLSADFESAFYEMLEAFREARFSQPRLLDDASLDDAFLTIAS